MALSNAEKQRAYRERKKARERAAVRRGNGSWPPFESGNGAAVVHGGSSARYVDPLAAAIAEELTSGPDCPPHVTEPRFRRSLLAWARQEAICALIGSWVASLDLQGALAEQVTSDESSSYKGGRGSKRTVLTRLESAIAALDRAERRAQSLRNDLLITPAAAHRARLEVGQKPFNLMTYWMEKDREKGSNGE